MGDILNLGYQGNPGTAQCSVDENGFGYGNLPLLPFRTFTVAPGQSFDTGVSVNGGYMGRTILVIASEHWSDGNNTGSGIYMIRCGYNGGNWGFEVITEQNRRPVSFSVNSSGNLVATADIGAVHVAMIMNK